jgi:hypothetical protein
MKIVNRKINELIKADYNPRKISDKDFEQLKKSLETFECVEPIVVNQQEGRENVIVGGHQRLKAMDSLGWKEVPTIEVNLNLEQEKELNVRLNKNTGEFDFEILSDEFEINDLLDFGFTDFDLGVEGADVEDDGESFDLPDGDRETICSLTFKLSIEQREFIEKKIKEYMQTDEFKYCETFGNENRNGNAIYGLLR